MVSSDVEMVELMVCDADVAALARQDGAIGLIEDPELSELAARILERRASEAYFEPLEVLAELPPAMAERVRIRLDTGAVGQVAQSAAREWFARHAERAARHGRKALYARLRAAEHRGDTAEVTAVLEALRGA